MAQLPHFSVKVTAPPPAWPLSLPAIKAHLRVNVPDDDDYISDLMASATEWIAQKSGRAMLSTGYLVCFDRFPLLPNSQYSPGNPNMQTPVLQNTWPLDPSAWALILPRFPLLSIDSLNYYDGNDVLQTLDPSAYVLDSNSEPPRLAPVSGSYWPSVSYRPNSVQVSIQAGYATVEQIPATAKHLIRLLVGHWYENREGVSSLDLKNVPMAIDALMESITPGYIW